RGGAGFTRARGEAPPARAEPKPPRADKAQCDLGHELGMVTEILLVVVAAQADALVVREEGRVFGESGRQDHEADVGEDDAVAVPEVVAAAGAAAGIAAAAYDHWRSGRWSGSRGGHRFGVLGDGTASQQTERGDAGEKP